VITRADAVETLGAWVAGTLDEHRVWEWIQARVGDPQDESSLPPTFEDDLVRDILDILAGMPHDLVTSEDAQVMLDALSNPPNETDLSQNLLWNHIDSIDTDGRRAALREHPFYGPFAGPEPY